ncbi:MAG: nucleotidyltransferase domain-containing protein [Chloroflexia bacterium]
MRLDEWRRRREERQRALERALSDVVAQLRALGARKVILFGSLARGDIGPHSDLDLIVILPPTHSGRVWMQRIYAEVDRRMAGDILAYTEDEFREVLEHSTFLRRAVREGKVVYEA